VAKYDIDPDGVKKVLDSTQTEAGKLAEILGPLGDTYGPASGAGPHGSRAGIVTSVATACGNSGAIVPALGEFFEVQQTNLTAMSTRIGACLTGAAAATNAYLHGDEEMVATYQQNASQLKISEYPPK
jgi:hypothetical protein